METAKKFYRAVVPLSIRRRIYHLRNSNGLSKAAPPIGSKKARKAAMKSHVRRALHFRSRMKIDVALREAYQALAYDPHNTLCQHLLADILADAGRFEAAKGVSRQLLETWPLDVRAIKRLRAMGEDTEFASSAIEHFDLEAAEPEGFLPILQFLYEAGEFVMLEQFAAAAIAKITPDTHSEVVASLYGQKAMAIEFQGDHERAIAAFADVPRETKARGKLIVTLARCHLELGDFAKAEAALREIYGHASGRDLPYNSILQSIFYKTGRIDAAHSLYRNRKTTQIVSSYFDKTSACDVDFKSLGGSVVLLAEGGPGDEIRFSTMYQQLADQFDRLAISASPRLMPLLTRSFPDIEFIPCNRYRNEFIPSDLSDRLSIKERGLLYFVNDEAAERAFAADHAFAMCDTLEDMRASEADFNGAARLIPDTELVEKWRQQTRSDKKRIGLSWRSLLRSSSRDRHYLDIKDLEPLRLAENCEFWLAQPGATAEEIDHLSKLVDLKIPAGLDLKDDFDGQAALFTALDAVISPLTTTCELAGAVGARTLILSTTHIASWRRQDDGKDIWYNSARVIHGEPIWNKNSLLSNLIAEIRKI